MDRRRALTALCATEVVSYGTLYYAFPVLAGDISQDTGWSRTAVTAAFSAGSLAGAAAGVPVGRVIARRGPRLVMTTGSALGAVGLVAIAAAPTFGLFVLAWLVAGAASAGLFYPPAFAALTGWYGADRVSALTALTLVAGFSSTIFAPLTAFLSGRMSWRWTYVTLALVLATTAAVHAHALRVPWRADSRDRRAARQADRAVLRSGAFLWLTAAMAAATFASFAALIGLVPLLTGRGLSDTAAAWALGLGGAGQVAGRLAYRPLTALRPPIRAGAIIGAAAICTLILAVLPGPAVVLVVAAVLAGAARGLFTLLQATAVSDRWGIEAFAGLNGVFNAPISAAAAVAPSLGAGMAAALGGYPAMFAALAAITVGAAVAAARLGSPAGVPE